jgi:LysM repeat protein
MTKGSRFRGTRIWVLPVVAATVMLAWTSAPATAAASERYRVRAGDTLTALAARHRTTVGAIARLNKLDPMGVLPIGVVLILPAWHAPQRFEHYVVRYGDTLSQIASLHGTDVTHIAQINHLDPESLLLKGQRLLLPERPTRQAIRASIRRWADHYRIPRPLALALAWQESGHQADVVSKAGAIGVMQVMPDTWAYVQHVLIGRQVPHTPDGNVVLGAGLAIEIRPLERGLCAGSGARARHLLQQAVHHEGVAAVDHALRFVRCLQVDLVQDLAA